ncbi:heavy metal-binding domain-containing protein [Lacihabitans sp. LS3-19]|uniref:heavy metal-binding domain-containing protein n=1 Tax=Lacihabitans sp. LS3-19 TaxID=2487335 RepID=UPI0020CDD046|nr:heavy metal-binding domain-containing protein [Lacihabitans sp. LS3-19]
MKKIAVLALFIAFAAASCSTESKTEEAKEEQLAEVYACPMHPEITGIKGDTCSICHMDLTLKGEEMHGDHMDSTMSH